jgi:hypothetical protein
MFGWSSQPHQNAVAMIAYNATNVAPSSQVDSPSRAITAASITARTSTTTSSGENTNGLLRQYLPKGKDLSFYGPGLLDNIAHELNGRPRKTLDWDTPAEALAKLLSGQSGTDGVALTP